MDENNTKDPEPSTSNKECQKEHSDRVLYKKKGYDDSRSNSDSSSMGSYSVNSRIKIAEAHLEESKVPTEKKASKSNERRRRSPGGKRRRGRVDKRKRSMTRRQLVRRPLKRRLRVDRKRDISMSTLFTKLSPHRRRRSSSPSYQYCRHCCYYRR